jgi:hypothetical protein
VWSWSTVLSAFRNEASKAIELFLGDSGDLTAEKGRHDFFRGAVKKRLDKMAKSGAPCHVARHGGNVDVAQAELLVTNVTLFFERAQLGADASPTDNALVVPRWLTSIGRFSVPVTLFLALDLVYEQTLLTWSSGEQMVGFTVSPVLGPLILLSLLMSYAFLLGVSLYALVGWLRQRKLPKIPWPLILTLSVAIGVTYIPYRFWKYTVLGRCACGLFPSYATLVTAILLRGKIFARPVF